jgi:hypothetical protein
MLSGGIVGRYMGIKKRVFFSAVIFFILLVAFKNDAISVSCPVISCDAPTGCFGACRSFVNPAPFFALVVIAIILPPVFFSVYRRL